MLDVDKIVKNLKEHEGFRAEVYQDTLGFDTVGFGTKMPLSKQEATVILRMRLNDKITELKNKKPLFSQLPFEAQEILVNMAYQLGVNGLLKFKKTWRYLENYEFKKAAVEMLDSTWYKQTPNRAKELSKRMEGIE